MDAAHFFALMARDQAKQKAAQLASLERECAGLRKQIVKLEAGISVAREATGRADSYPITAVEPTCPICWIEGRHSTVRAIGGGTDEHDVFRCNGTCGNTFNVPAR